MKRSTFLQTSAIALLACVAVVGTAAPSSAGHDSRIVVSGHAGVRVWVDGGDVFGGYDDVALWLRPDRDCYTTLFLVDTAGYMHVLYPTSPYESAWMDGGRTYRFEAWELGLDRLDGRGIAYVFAVGSPVPFDYGTYGASVFLGGFGFRIYGDPFVASRHFYLSLLPAHCAFDYVGVSYARFYVREWVRYPSYLCHARPGIHVRIGDSCGACNDVYVSYRGSVAHPYDVIRPTGKFKSGYTGNRAADTRGAQQQAGRVERVERAERERASFTNRPKAVGAKAVATNARAVTKTVVREARPREAVKATQTPARREVTFNGREPARADKVRVVSTSRGTSTTQRRASDVRMSEAPTRQKAVKAASAPTQPRVSQRAVTKSSAATQKAAAEKNATTEKGARKKARQAR